MAELFFRIFAFARVIKQQRSLQLFHRLFPGSPLCPVPRDLLGFSNPKTEIVLIDN